MKCFTSKISGFVRKHKLPLFICAVVVAVLLVFAAEAAFSNRTAIGIRLGHYTDTALDLESASCRGKVKLDGGNIYVTGQGAVTFSELDTDTAYLTLDISGNGYCNMTASLTDDASAISKMGAGSYRLYLGDRAYELLGIDSAGKAHSITVEFSADCDGVVIYGAALNRAGGFRFNFLRFAAVVFILALVFAACVCKAGSTPFDAKKKSHAALLCVVFILCILFTAFGCVRAMGFDLYPFTGDVGGYSCYQQQADAFIKGRLDLDITVDKSQFESLDNVYDYFERYYGTDDMGKTWDRAYYNGKFYSYFGVAPVLTSYLPMAAIFGVMPRDGTVSAGYTAAAVVMMTLCLLALLKFLGIKPSLLQLLLGVPALCASSLVYVLNVHPAMYYIAVIAGITYFASAAFFSFLAAMAKSNAARRVFLVLAGVSVVLTVMSRPNILLFAVALVPLYLKMFFGKDRPVRTRLADFAFVAVPVAVGAVGVMWYNAARFSSPLDFGSAYQLTLYDMGHTGLSAYKFFPAMYHYFLQPVAFTGVFPFMRIDWENLAVYRNYVYIFGTAGAVNFPVTLGALAIPASSRQNKMRRYTLGLLALTAVAVAFFDFCLAGSHIRYMGDLMFPLALAGIAALMAVSSENREGSAGSFVRKLTVIFMLVSIIVAAALLFANEADNIRVFAPKLFRFFESFFI